MSDDPCEDLNCLDFENEEDLKSLLLMDKHTRIEGLFTEVFFYEEIVKARFNESSTGWWFTKKDYRYRISRLILSLERLNAIDIELLELFSSRCPHVYIVEFCEAEKTFFYGRYRYGIRERIKDDWERIKKPHPRNKNKADLPPVSVRDLNRLNQAISYLTERGEVKKYAIERMFANCWLGNAYYWDIDYFVKFKGRLFAFEVKQKFPGADGTFGLNTGLAKLFNHLHTLGITVVHVILTKPIHDVLIPAIDQYMKEEYRKSAKWIATRFSPSLLQRKKRKAPSYTSLRGNSPMYYYPLYPEDFSLIKEVGPV